MTSRARNGARAKMAVGPKWFRLYGYWYLQDGATLRTYRCNDRLPSVTLHVSEVDDRCNDRLPSVSLEERHRGRVPTGLIRSWHVPSCPSQWESPPVVEVAFVLILHYFNTYELKIFKGL